MKSEWKKAWADAESSMKMAIVRRDEGRCRICKRGGTRRNPLQVHHALAKRGKKSVFFNPTNLITLCSACHQQATNDWHDMNARVVTSIVRECGIDLVTEVLEAARKTKKHSFAELVDIQKDFDSRWV